MDTLRNGESSLVNTNKMIRNYSGATGLKTGSTSVALFNLSASATRNNLSLIAVILKGETSAIRFAEATKLLDYGFSNFEFAKYSNKEDVAKKINVDKGIVDTVEVIYAEDAGALIPKGQSTNITTTVDLKENFQAPIEEGQILGSVTYSINNETLGTVNLVASKPVPKLNLGNMISNVLDNWIYLLK